MRATPWVRRYDQAGETALDETSFPHPQSFPTTYSAPSASRQYINGTRHFYQAPTSPPQHPAKSGVLHRLDECMGQRSFHPSQPDLTFKQSV